jgi:hypothetical protein
MSLSMMTDYVPPDSFELPIELDKEFTSSICPTHSNSLLSAIHRQFKAQSVVEEYCTTDDGCGESDCTTDFSSDSDIGEDRLDVNIDDEVENVHWVEEDEGEALQWRDLHEYDVEPAEEEDHTDLEDRFLLNDFVNNRVYPIAVFLQCRAWMGRSAVDSCPDRATCQVKPYWKEDHSLPSKKSKPKGKTQSKTARQLGVAAQSILGKLAADNTEIVLTELLDIGFDRAEHMPLLLDHIFEFAVQHHQRLAVYAELCVRLAQNPNITSMVYSTGKQVCFRRLLHMHCERIFRDLLDVFDKQKTCHDEGDQEWKQRTLGSVKFIAQLIVVGLLPSNMLVDCADELLGRHDRCSQSVRFSRHC